MKNRALRKFPTSVLVGILSTWAVACTQDPADDDGMGGDTSTGGKDSEDGSGGKKGSGGGKATGGEKSTGGSKATGGAESSGGSESSGGDAGAENSGGQGGETSGTGGETAGTGGETAGTGGETGGGTGGANNEPAAIARLHQVTLPQFSDIRGLSYGAGGKLYATGYITVDSDREVAVARILPNGDLDDTFGDAGIASWNLVERELDAETVVVDGVEDSYGIIEVADGGLFVHFNARQPDNSGTWVGVLRVDASGEPVDSFGEGGIVHARFNNDLEDESETWSDTSWGFALDTMSEPGTDKLVVFGHGGVVVASPAVTDNDRYVTRLLADTGAVDSAFNGGAVFRLDTGANLSDGARRGLVLPDGSILSSGYTNFGTTGGGNNVVLIKLTPAGVPDPNFGFVTEPASTVATLTDGVAIFNPFFVDGGVSECYAAAVQSTGRLVTTGYGRATGTGIPSTLGYATSSAQDAVNFGVLADGLDPAFGDDGQWAIQSELVPGATLMEERGRDLVVLPDDRVVYAGRFDVGPALMIGRKNGGYDETVGDSLSGRFQYTSATAGLNFYSIALSEDGTRVAAATNGAAEGVLIAVLRVGDE